MIQNENQINSEASFRQNNAKAFTIIIITHQLLIKQ